MCERARRYLEATFPLEGKKVLPPGAPIFLPRATLRFPQLAGLANTILHFVGNGSYTLYTTRG